MPSENKKLMTPSTQTESADSSLFEVSAQMSRMSVKKESVSVTVDRALTNFLTNLEQRIVGLKDVLKVCAEVPNGAESLGLAAPGKKDGTRTHDIMDVLMHLELALLTEEKLSVIEADLKNCFSESEKSNLEAEARRWVNWKPFFTEIGAGAFGKVFRVTVPNGPKEENSFAIKVVHVTARKWKSKFRQERSMIRRIHKKVTAKGEAPNVISYLRDGLARFDGAPVSFHMDYAHGGDMWKHTYKGFIQHRERVPPAAIYHYVSQIGNGIVDMHSNGLVHGDLKLGNVFMHKEGEDQENFLNHTLKIGDFGASVGVGKNGVCEEGLGFCATYPPMRPEDEFTAAVDWHAMGVILLQFLAGYGEKECPELFNAAKAWMGRIARDQCVREQNTSQKESHGTIAEKCQEVFENVFGEDRANRNNLMSPASLKNRSQKVASKAINRSMTLEMYKGFESKYFANKGEQTICSKTVWHRIDSNFGFQAVMNRRDQLGMSH